MSRRVLYYWLDRALISFSSGRVVQPVRNILTIEKDKRFMGVMPVVTDNAMGVKLVCFYPVNAGSSDPTHTAMILLFDPANGRPLAAMDGRLITEMRTAAVSAAVTKHLMPEGARILALLGSGVQAMSHLEAMQHIGRFDDVRVWSRNADHARQFAEKHGARAMDAVDW